MLLALLLVLAFSQTEFIQTHSWNPPFIGTFSSNLGDSLRNDFWDYGDDAIVLLNSAIRVVSDKQGQMGWIWTNHVHFY